MLTLTLDAQNNRIVIEDTEAKHPVDIGMVSTPNLDIWVDCSVKENMPCSKIELSMVDFEGFVFNLVDPSGNRWSSEIMGMVAGG